jgi:hypothetical protein
MDELSKVVINLDFFKSQGKEPDRLVLSNKSLSLIKNEMGVVDNKVLGIPFTTNAYEGCYIELAINKKL